MILADTSIWIDFFKITNPSVDEQMAAFLEARMVYGISVVFGELLQGARDDREEKIILDYWKNLPRLDEQDLFVEGGWLSYQHKLFSKGMGLIDCYIIAAAKLNQMEIWTHDKKLVQAFKLAQ